MKSLFDPWSSRGPIPLDRPFERWGLYPLLMAFVALVVAFITFQMLGLAISGVMLAAQGVGIDDLAEISAAFLVDHLELFLISNSIAQMVGLGLLALGLAWLHSSRFGSFLRFRKVDPQLLMWSLLGLIVLLPVVWWLGHLNQMLPVPDYWAQFEEGREVLTEAIVAGRANTFFVIGMVAVIPALCEELIFRGYAQRQMERSLGVAGAIVLCGILFGFFHLTLLQLVPLSVLGMYLAYLTWRTGSLWPAIVAHFANNAVAIVASQAINAEAETQMQTLESMEPSWYIVVAALIFFVIIIYALEDRVASIHPD